MLDCLPVPWQGLLQVVESIEQFEFIKYGPYMAAEGPETGFRTGGMDINAGGNGGSKGTVEFPAGK